MCGIVGFITKPVTAKQPTKHQLSSAYQRANWFKQALLFDTVRGEHSTGVMGRTVGGEYNWLKQAVPGYEFIMNKDFHEQWLEQAIEYETMIGHNRAATVGSVTTDNAHPFEHGPVTLVHNGTLRDTGPLEHQQASIEVDSSLIAYNLSLAEPGDAAKVLGQLDGAYALVWTDERDDSINIVRNGQRPLHMAATRDSSTLYFMSEGAMLEMILDRNKISYDAIYQLGVHKWLKFTGSDLVPEVKDVVPFTRPVTAHTAYPTYAGGYDRPAQAGNTSTASPIPANRDLRLQLRNNRKVAQPAVFAETLSWFDLHIRDELEFDPDCFYGYPRSRHATGNPLPLGDVQGEVWFPDLQEWVDARLVGVGERVFELYHNKMWTVRPVCITWEKDVMTVHCKFVAPTVTAEARALTAETAPELDDDIPWGDEGDSLSMYLGPNGNYVTEYRAKELLEHGCGMCSKDLRIQDMADYEWVGELRNMPLCPDCQTDVRGWCS
jgi:hypothetical protein